MSLKNVNFFYSEFKWVCKRMKFVILFSAFLFLNSCNKFGNSQGEVIARVESNYLYKSDLEKRFESIIKAEDSLIKTQRFIEDWAKDILLYEQALVNLPQEKIIELEDLVKEYRSDLFSANYKEYVVSSSIDTIVEISERKSFYEENKGVFKLTQPLYQIRVLQFPSNNVERKEITRSFRRFNEEDRFFLDSISFHFTKIFLNDTLWISQKRVLDQVSFLTMENLDNYLRKERFFQVESEGEVYLLYVNDFIKRDQIAPLSYVAVTIDKIILNKKKLEFIKQFDREILQDAIQSKKFENY